MYIDELLVPSIWLPQRWMKPNVSALLYHRSTEIGGRTHCNTTVSMNGDEQLAIAQQSIAIHSLFESMNSRIIKRAKETKSTYGLDAK